MNIVPIHLLNIIDKPSSPKFGFVSLYFKNKNLTSVDDIGVERDIVLNRLLTGFLASTADPILSSDNVLQAFEKTQANIDRINAAIVSITAPSVNYNLLVYFNTTDPNDVNTVFTNSLGFVVTGAQEDILYVSRNAATKGQMWVYDGATYLSYDAEDNTGTTPFFLLGTTVDAKSNKTADIERSGGIKASTFSGDGSNITGINPTNILYAKPVYTVKVATTQPLPAVTYGTEILTADVDGVLMQIDGVTLAVNDEVLIKNEVLNENNGIYKVINIGTSTTPWQLQRKTGYTKTSEIHNSQVNVLEGTHNAGKSFIQTTVNPVIETSPLVYIYQNIFASEVIEEVDRHFITDDQKTLLNNITLTSAIDLEDVRSRVYKTNIPNIYVNSLIGVDANTANGTFNNPYKTCKYAVDHVQNTWSATLNVTLLTIEGIPDALNNFLKEGDYVTGTYIDKYTTIITKNNEGGNSNSIVLSKYTLTASPQTDVIKFYRFYNVIVTGPIIALTSNILKPGFTYDFGYNFINYGEVVFEFTQEINTPVFVKGGIWSSKSDTTARIFQSTSYLNKNCDIYFDPIRVDSDAAIVELTNGTTNQAVDCLYINATNINTTSNFLTVEANTIDIKVKSIKGAIDIKLHGTNTKLNLTGDVSASILRCTNVDTLTYMGNFTGSGLEFTNCKGLVTSNVTATYTSLDVCNINWNGSLKTAVYQYGGVVNINGSILSYNTSTNAKVNITGFKQDGFVLLNIDGSSMAYIDYKELPDNITDILQVSITTGSTLINYGKLNLKFVSLGGTFIDNNGTILHQNKSANITGTIKLQGTTFTLDRTLTEGAGTTPTLYLTSSGKFIAQNSTLTSNKVDSLSGFVTKIGATTSVVMIGCTINMANDLHPIQILNNTTAAKEVIVEDCRTTSTIDYTEAFSNTTYGTAYPPIFLGNGLGLTQSTDYSIL